MIWSQQVVVNAKNKTEAKKKGWERFISKKPIKKYYKIYTDEVI